MSIAIYENTCYGKGIQGSKIVRDDKGYFRAPVGAFECSNNVGEYYPLAASVKQIFDESSIFQRRVRQGYVCGEISHPEYKAGMTKMDWIKRNLDIDPVMKSQHFRRFTLEDGKDEHGRKIVIVMAELIETGNMGPALTRSLNNVEENVAWSFRGFSIPTKDGNGRILSRLVKEVVTYDNVPEGGLKCANKHAILTQESFSELELQRLEALDSINPVTTESHMDSRMIRSVLGWQKIEVITPSSFTEWR